MRTALTEKQANFVRHFRDFAKLHGAGTYAAVKAGYGGNRASAAALAYQLLQLPEIQHAILCRQKGNTFADCVRCGKSFRFDGRAKHCSQACAKAAQNDRRKAFREERICAHCGDFFQATKGQIYCSGSCRSTHLLERHREMTRRGEGRHTPEQIAAWRARSNADRLRGKAAITALRELGINV